MRILIVSQEYPPETGGGGIGTQSYLKAQGLSARGHHVEVVSASWENPRTERDGGALLHRIKPQDFGQPASNEAMSWMSWSMTVAQKLWDMNADKNFDIIQFPEYGAEGFIYQFNNFQFHRARYVVQLHGPLAMFVEHMGWPEPGSTYERVGCFMEETVIHHADGVMASSHNTAGFCARRYHYPQEQINVIHSGIDIDRFKPLPRVDDGAFPRILFVGSFVSTKGFDLLVQAGLRLRRRYPRLCMRMIGKGGEESVARIKKEISDAGAEQNIQFVHYVPYTDLPGHYAWADMFAGPSWYEPGPGNVYLEAMSCGTPVIACNTAGTPEVVGDGKTGILIPPRDLDALEQAIVTLAESQEMRQRLGQAGRAWVTENVSLPCYLDKVEKFYQRVLQDRGKDG